MPAEFKPEDLLALLLFGLSKVLNPSPARVLETLEAWNCENHLRHELRRLESRGWMQRDTRRGTKQYSLTRQGQTAAWGAIDPRARWQRAWDGQWRLLLFDLPTGQHTLRVKLWRWMRGQRFGYLQNSVWISPDAVNQSSLPLPTEPMKAEAFSIIEGRPVAGGTDAEMVLGAWDFDEVRERYERYLKVIEQGRELALRSDATPLELRKWLSEERQAWLAAIARDPLLPQALWPAGYLGRQALAARAETFAAFIPQGPGEVLPPSV